MAQIWRHRHAIAAALSALAALIFAPVLAQDQGPAVGTDLYERPVLAVDPGMHTAKIWSLAVDTSGHFAVTGSDDRTVRIWSVADGKLLRTIWIPVGPESVGDVYAVAISPDGSTIAAGGYTEKRQGGSVVYIFDRESGNLVRRIADDLPDVTFFVTFSPDGRYLAAMLAGRSGLRVFDHNKNWSQAFRDDQYGDRSEGATFASNGRLTTSSLDGLIRSYQYDPNSDSPNFRRVAEPFKAPSGKPREVAYSPGGTLLAVGYIDVAAVDVLDGTTLERVGGHKPADVSAPTVGAERIAWSRDGQTLFAAGAVHDAHDRRLLFAWDRGGLGDEKRMTYCAPTSAIGVDALPDARILVAAAAPPCLGLMNADGHPVWTVGSRVFDFRDQEDALKASVDGSLVDFVYRDPTSPRITQSEPTLRFDLRSLKLSSPPPNDSLTFTPLREGLTIDGWRSGTSPTLNARPIPFTTYDIARSVAVAPEAKRFFLGSSYALAAFDDAGKPIWRSPSRSEVWAVNATRDERVVVTADGDGAIRWHRADDGRELLALQVLPNGKEPAKWDWVLWTPEGFYEAMPGAEDVLKWVVNHGPDKAATTLPVSAIAKLHRRNALPHVLDQLETAHALGVDDISQARCDVQTVTGSAKPPGGVLHVLAIGVDKFGDKAGGLHLDYAADDARDVAKALLKSQKGSSCKAASLYADVSLRYLLNDEADGAAILDTLDDMARSMARNEPGQDVAVILVSSHGEMIDKQFYLIPYGFDAGSEGKSIKSAVSASEFAKKVQALAKYGKVLLLLDACHSGAVGAQGWATDPDAKILQDAMDLENVTVLTSSKKGELSEELPDWKHGALAQAFLGALVGAADPQGIVRLSALAEAMANDVQSLTKGRQHLGMHINFSGDLFVASHD
jgi:DNA-binding beta-propeller fold protein YncE